MPNEIQQKVNHFLKLKANPALGLFEFTQELEKKIDDFLQKELNILQGKIQQIIENKINEKIDNISKNNIFAHITSLRGEMGPKGDKPTEEEIMFLLQKVFSERKEEIRGLRGYEGKAGENGKSPSEKEITILIKKLIMRMGDQLRGEKGEMGPQGIPGISPKINIQEFISKVEEQIDTQKILQQLAELKKMIEEIKREKVFGGVQKTLTGGGGPSLVWNEAVGVGDNTTLIFTLTNTPYSSSDLQVWVGGGIQFLTDDFTLSGRNITFLTAPPTDAKIRATYRK